MKLLATVLTLCLATQLLFSQSLTLRSTLTSQQLQKLTDQAGDRNHKFGTSVAIEDDTAVIGIPGDNLVIVYQKDPSTGLFTRKANLKASVEPTFSKSFGNSVAIHNNTIVVGAYYFHGSSRNTGAAYIFVKPLSGGWVDAFENAKLTASNGVTKDYFGWSVTIDNDTVVVGADKADANKAESGAAYIFTKPFGGWVDAFENARLTAQYGGKQDYFGRSVAIDNNTVVIGAYKDNINNEDNGNAGTDAGSAYIFTKPVGGWVDAHEEAQLTARDGASRDYFGSSVAIDNNTILVGSPGNSLSGAAYLFTKPQTGWKTATENAKLIASDTARYIAFGNSVSIQNNTVLVGAYQAKAVYLFSKPQGGWINNIKEDIKLTASGGYFGCSVDISNDLLLIGANGDNHSGTYSGSAYLFQNKPASTMNPPLIMYLLH